MLIFNFKKQPLKTSSNKSAWCHPLLWLIPYLMVFYCKQNSPVSCWIFSNIWRKKSLLSVRKLLDFFFFLRRGRKLCTFVSINVVRLWYTDFFMPNNWLLSLISIIWIIVILKRISWLKIFISQEDERMPTYKRLASQIF